MAIIDSVHPLVSTPQYLQCVCLCGACGIRPRLASDFAIAQRRLEPRLQRGHGGATGTRGTAEATRCLGAPLTATFSLSLSLCAERDRKASNTPPC